MLPNFHFLLPFDFVVHVWEKAYSNEHPVSFNVWCSFFSQLLYMESPQATSENLRSVFNLHDLAIDHQNSFDDPLWIWWIVGVTVGLSSFPGHRLLRAVCTESDGSWAEQGPVNTGGSRPECLGQILANCGYCLRKLVVVPLHVSPTRETSQLWNR